jgi:chemotaxis signal transduction protein
MTIERDRTTAAGASTEAERLRREFDDAFTVPPPAEADVGEDEVLLEGRAGLEPFALRRDQVRKLARAKRIVPLPSTSPSLLGLVAWRGVLVPVFCLARLLGREGGEPRWLVLLEDTEPFAVTFSAYEGQRRVPRWELRAVEGPAEGLIRAVVGSGAVARPVLDLQALRARVPGQSSNFPQPRSVVR